jgi:dephospho-CoA kinase
MALGGYKATRPLTSTAVVVVGLTGGIGAGKSTVAALLAARGAIVIDADQIARQVVEPGAPAYNAIVERFGPEVVGNGGGLDRAALAGLVFKDPGARTDLEKITHPAIQAEMARQTLEAPADGVVILDIPLLKAKRDPMAGIIVVDAPENVAVARLVRYRDFKEDDARRRIAAQISRDDRLAIADVIVHNDGDRLQLEAEVDKAWAWIATLMR